ncbi:MAG: S8 family peptidase [Halioglobus sp.]
MTFLKKLAALPLAASMLCGTAYAADITPVQLEQMRASLPASTVGGDGVYMIQLEEPPAVAYSGGIKGIKATKPAKGQKFNGKSSSVRSYKRYLKGKQDEVLGSVGASEAIYNYGVTFNGFAAKLTGKQAATLRKQPGVKSVSKDTMMKLDTISTTEMLELRTGIWGELGGIDTAGEDVIVGILDSGVWPENPSFSDTTDLSDSSGNSGKRKLAYGPPPPRWNGNCRSGQNWSQNTCNNKLIGADWFVSGFTAHGKSGLLKYEFLSARDVDGHGSHTASTAAGNSGVPVVINGSEIGTASGMAPRARIAAYKVCWGTGSDGGCFGSDSVAAIDQAVIDGVDVLNFSISGSQTSFLDPVEVAFLFAAEAGVFVAASAGNSGDAASTVAHNSPWLTTVAAGTHDRGYTATVEVDGVDYSGVSLGAGVQGDLVYAGDAGDSQCNPGALDPAVAAGKIVLCDRGGFARVDKSRAVDEAGGIGMILANVTPGSLNADFHSVPSIHVNDVDGQELRDYLAGLSTAATADISEGELIEAEASQVAEFSSRGPALAGGGDLLKPDIMAPGVDVIAAVSPVTAGGNNFDAYSGTSMSSPHMAGFGALMKQLYPNWSPAMIKSAFMTTATTDTNKGNPIDGGALDYGAGFVQPNDATNPGLVYNAGFLDWLGFTCGVGELAISTCDFFEADPIDPSDLNYPSIAIGALAGSQTVTRTVTEVGDGGTYYPAINAPSGLDIQVEPSSLTLAPGDSVSYDLTITNTAAELNTWLEGDIVWSDEDGQSVRSPIVVRAVEFAAPAELSETGAEGAGSIDVTFGYEGAYDAVVSGLVAASTQEGTVVDDPSNDINTALGTGVGISVHVVDSNPAASIGRISLFDDYTDGNDDLDLYVFDEAFGFVGGSGSGTSAEQVDIPHAQIGSPFYVVVVHGWETDGPDANYRLFSWFPGDDKGNLTIDTDSVPPSATLGASEKIGYTWAVDEDAKYMGSIDHVKGTDLIGRTVIRIDND